MPTLPRLTALALLLLPVGSAVAQEADPTVRASLPRATVVGADGGWTAWSAYTGSGYALVTRSPAGVEARPPVAPRKVPFDLDLGTDKAGRVVAAYSRCSTEPTLVGGANATAPNYTTGKGCRVVLLDLAQGTERTLPRSAGSSSDVLPSVGGDRVAFIAVPTARRLKGKAQLRWRTLTSAKAHIVDTGVRHAGTPAVASGPANVDTDGTRIAAIWRSEDPEFHSYDSVLRVGTFAGRPKQVAYGSNGESCTYDQVIAPTLEGSTVTFVETDGAQWALSRTPVTRDKRTYGNRRLGDDVVITSAAVDGARLVVAETAAPKGIGHAAGPTQVREVPLDPFVSTSPITDFCG